MRIPRIFTSQDLSTPLQVQLAKDAANHVSRVLRMSKGQQIELFNGDGHSYIGTLTTVDRTQVSVEIKEVLHGDNESPLTIHLYQGVSRGDKMDLTLQKGVELGVQQFTPLITERCGVKLDEKRWQKKHEHWQKVIESACEQCGRNIIPTLHPAIKLQAALEQLTSNSFFMHPDASDSFKSINADTQSELQLWVGPEGGFSDEEINWVETHGCKPVRLGPRVLRTETAALAAVAVMNSVWGDF
ncbi:16S rRNA (uracil(1498)-N(3))-methyltransferase [Kangiella sp.]|uniref:16S rRNA (uracil(1498)-N(3))-methyltransferase n=1 Tax=Kangiella sp. TaxID=1920245 RepID=UPI0019A3D393|nr:16S rRNA (uracil(1498)-N(3))-methyltransferase [Kangiella sp.]MBD3652676.1 16S rRNA (uracil(1498)-N(3))-methyltransferase [Kangiella sp.]